ncbi:hypothetical protein PILCRDRAFT_822254, partial [Piloderma croceum F 1598]
MVMFFSSNDRMTAHNFEASVPEQIYGVRSRVYSISSLPECVRQRFPKTPEPRRTTM